MIKTLTAFTSEIDDAEIAVDEILGQLSLKENLLANSIGLVTCYSECIDSGIVKALSDALPFDIIGCTSMGFATNGEVGHLLFTITVITSDDVFFSAGISNSVLTEQDTALSALYSSLKGRLSTDPVFMVSFMPLIYTVGGDVFIECLNKASDNLPLFGTLAVDHTKDYSESKTIYNGETYTDCLALVVVGGNIHPEFIVESISEDRYLKQKAIITASEANLLMEVNGVPVVKYMETLGLTKDGKIEGPSTIPFLVDFNDGTKPVTRAIFAETPEGYAVCGGVMPVNSTLSISAIDYDEVIRTTTKITEEILNRKSLNGVLMFSCVGRNYALGIKTCDEMHLAEEKLGGALPYQLAYSGGEVCPLYDNDGILKNRFHNDTIIACLF